MRTSASGWFPEPLDSAKKKRVIPSEQTTRFTGGYDLMLKTIKYNKIQKNTLIIFQSYDIIKLTGGNYVKGRKVNKNI